MVPSSDRLAVCTVTSYNHLHLTLNLVRSIRRHWRSNPAIYVVLIDHPELPRPGYEALSDVNFVPIEQLGIRNLTWQRIKQDAFQMCAVARPFALEFVLDRGHAEVFYCDSDVQFFADAAPFLAERKSADFVLTPHIVSPMARDDVWVPASIGQVTSAGVVNNGMFLCRNTKAARAFLRQYGDFMSGPAAEFDDLGSVRDQHFFNWVAAFGADVQISRDTRMNAAYWNLHERPIRWAQLDGGPADRWTLDGEALISFHFSGFDWDNGRLSTHDFHPSTLWNASLHALCDYYRESLRASFADRYANFPYQYAILGDTKLTAGLRLEFKRSARNGEPELTDWASSALKAFRHLNAATGTQYLLPHYFENLMRGRPDLQSITGGERIHAPFLLWWANKSLEREYDFGAVWERFAEWAFHKGYLRALADAVLPQLPDHTAEQIDHRLRHDRRALLEALRQTAASPDVIEKIEAAEYRYLGTIPAQCVRLIYDGWQTLQRGYPDPLGRDFAAFKNWLATDFPREFDVPPAVADFAASFDVDRSLARVIGFARRDLRTAEIFRAQGLSKPLLVAMIGLATRRLGYSADDLIVADWWLVGRSAEQVAAMGAYAPDDVGTPSGDRFVEAWIGRRGTADEADGARHRLTAAGLTTYLAAIADGECRAAEHADAPSRADGMGGVAKFCARASAAARQLANGAARPVNRGHASLEPVAGGINLFGYFKSPIGVGVASKGLSKALTAANYDVRENLLLSDAMDADFTLSDLELDFAFNYPRTLTVSYPHIGYRMRDILPAAFARGRETIGYLAWEQRDFPRQWRPVVDQYDTVCALSAFAAESIARGVGRPVYALPCVVEIQHDIGKTAARRMYDIPDGKFVVGFAFDAGSSTDRKNPMAFAEATIRAFSGKPNVLIFVKYASAARPDFATRFVAFRDRLARSGIEYRIITDYVDRARVEAFIACLDVYVSLHRSEGFGYTLAEAMLLGVPTLATGYSGNLDFMNPENSFLVDFRETIVSRRDGPFDIGTVWAEPDIDDAVDKLRSIYADSSVALAKARRAKAEVAATVSVAAVARRLKEIFG